MKVHVDRSARGDDGVAGERKLCRLEGVRDRVRVRVRDRVRVRVLGSGSGLVRVRARVGSGAQLRSVPARLEQLARRVGDVLEARRAEVYASEPARHHH